MRIIPSRNYFKMHILPTFPHFAHYLTYSFSISVLDVSLVAHCSHLNEQTNSMGYSKQRAKINFAKQTFLLAGTTF